MLTVALTAVCTIALLAIGGNQGSTAISMAGAALPFVVWAWRVRTKRKN
jgi:PPE-repeat protein